MDRSVGNGASQIVERERKRERERALKTLSAVKVNSSALVSRIVGAPCFVWLIFFLARVTNCEHQPSQSAVEAVMVIFQRKSGLGQFYKHQEINSSFITHLAFQVDACCCCSVDHPYPTLRDPMDCHTPGLPAPHHLPEFASVMSSSHLNF